MVDQFNHNSYESFCLAVVQKSFRKMVPFHTCVDYFVNIIIQFFEDTAIHVANS